MSLERIVALWLAMVILAALPSVSVLAVTTQAATSGWQYGALTAMGIVLGDLIFILIAVLGLSFLIAWIGPFFVVLKLLGAAYLIWLGWTLGRSTPQTFETKTGKPTSKWSSFMTGFLLTLGDQKATLFYLGFFPAFVDLSKLSMLDILVLIAVTIVSVGGVKLGYAVLADRARLLIGVTLRQWMNRIAGSLMIAVGCYLVVQAIRIT